MRAMDAWLTRARDAIAEQAGMPAGELELDQREIETLLELAGVAAHESGARTNAPLLSYLVGRASTRAALADLDAAVRRSSR
jgi:hypothetical protein